MLGTLFPGASMAQDTVRPTAGDITVPRVPRSAKSLLTPPKPTVAPKKPVAPTPPAHSPEADKASPLRQRIVVLLSGFEYFPTKADLEQGTDEAAVSALLQQLVSDASERPLVRTKAVDALGYYADEESRELLLGLARTPVNVTEDRLGDSMRHHAITSLAKSQKDRAVGDLKPLLEDPDIQIRLSAVVALGKHAQQAARPVLLERLSLERNDTVTRELERYVRQAPSQPAPKAPPVQQPVAPTGPDVVPPVVQEEEPVE